MKKKHAFGWRPDKPDHRDRVTTERKPTGQLPGDKHVARMCPDNQLKPAKMRFEDTFSAETVVMERFFPGK